MAVNKKNSGSPTKSLAKPKRKSVSCDKTTESKEEMKQRIRIKIRAYDHKIIDESCKKIIEAVERSGAQVFGPVPLPTEISRYTVMKSSFVHKDSREQYERCIHKRLIDIINPAPRTIDSLTNLDLPAGIDIEIKM